MNISAFCQAIDCPQEQMCIKYNEPMKYHTSFRIGGPADIFISPKTENAVIAVIRAAKKQNIPLTVIGNGSNVLVRDEGIRGAVMAIGTDFGRAEVDGDTVDAQSGILLSVLAKTALEHSLTGLEFAAGIPGSLGGALFMDAGAYGGQMADVVVKTRYVDENLNIGTVTGDGHKFGYRTSIFKEHPNWTALSAEIRLKKGSYEEIKAKMDELAKRRRDKQPLNFPSAGSTFKRPEGYFAGKLIQDAGLMGYTVGGAQVSEKHAGFVVNKGNASCEDVLGVIEHIKNEVMRQFGVELEPEVRLL